MSPHHGGPIPLLLSTAIAFFSLALVAGGEIEDQIKKVTTTEPLQEGEKWCPVKLAGNQCPPSSPFHYYRCCGTLNNECCFNLQTWVVVALIGVGIVFTAIVLLSILRCVFCRRN